MNKDLKQAKELLSGGYTCVLCKNNNLLKTDQRGVKPLLEFLNSGKDFSGFSAADKVVGKGAAFLYVLLNIKAVYAKVISRSAKAVFDENNIHYEYDNLVPAIKNRTNTGFCPIESALKNIDNPHMALEKITETLKNL